MGGGGVEPNFGDPVTEALTNPPTGPVRGRRRSSCGQGLDIKYHALGYAAPMTPQKGGYTTHAPALDLTTSLRGDLRC